jgi:hypothetical protein
VEDEPCPIGHRAVTRHAVGRRLRFVPLDKVLYLPTLEVDVLEIATYAGFIDPVKPGIGGVRADAGGGLSSLSTMAAIPAAGGGPAKVDPIIRGLLARFSKSGDVWENASFGCNFSRAASS